MANKETDTQIDTERLTTQKYIESMQYNETHFCKKKNYIVEFLAKLEKKIDPWLS